MAFPMLGEHLDWKEENSNWGNSTPYPPIHPPPWSENPFSPFATPADTFSQIHKIVVAKQTKQGKGKQA